MCICDPIRGITCATHQEQAKAAASGQPMLDEPAARAAGWVPLADVLAALQDYDGFEKWAQAAGHRCYLDEVYPNDDVVADYLAERFSQ